MGIMMIAGTERRRQGCSLQDGKQWGYYVESQNPTDYRYWSIPFTSHYITMATKTYYEPKEEAVPWLVGIDMQKFICGYGANFIGSSYVSCVGIGCQPQWGKPTVRGNNIFPIPFPNSALAITSAGIGGWHTVDVSIVNNNSYSVLGWATDSPSTARTSLPNVIAIGF